MNFAKGVTSRGGALKCRYCALSLTLPVLLGFLGGCSDQVRMPTAEQLAAFEKAEPVAPRVDMQRIEEARLQIGPYRVVPGDVLEFTMPVLLQAVSAADLATAKSPYRPIEHPYLCRISEQGTIQLPGVGEIPVAGLSLSEIEVRVADAYRKVVALQPSVFARVFEYKMYSVYVTGAVEKPGVYKLQGDQMTLAHLLSEAGGILMRDAGGALMRDVGGVSGPGAALIRITPQDRSDGGKGTTGEQTIQDRGAGRIAVAFTPDDSHSTAGRLVLSRGEKVLLDEHLDLQNELQRRAALGKLCEITPDCSVLDLEERLIVVAGQAGANTSGRTNLAALDPKNPSGTATMAPQRPEGDPQRDLSRWGTQAVVLPVYGLNIPSTNVALREGDTVVVERLKVPMFSVVGLVHSPGNFPYPPDTQFNLMQAVAFAGGLDPVAEPRYATIYRLTADGSIVRVPFRLVQDGELTEAMTTPIKPGDVVAIEHTPRTRRNMIINNLVKINTGLYLTGSDLWRN